VVAAVSVLVLAGWGSPERTAVRIEPAEALLDGPLRLEAGGAEGSALVRLTLSATGEDGVEWAGTTDVRPDGAGRVSVDGGALLASLRPTGAPADDRELTLVPRGEELELRLEARQGTRSLGTARATRRMVAGNVSARELTVERDGLAGKLWTGDEGDRKPVAVLSLGGSEGGLGSDHVERLLASHGYPVLQLAYFGEKGLPGELREIPLEYSARALERLRADVDAERVVVLGTSRGGELALILGSRFPELVDGVVAYAPSSVVNSSLDCGPAWTHRGRPLPAAACTEFGNAGPANADAIIPVERIDGPLLTVAGIADAVWPAANYAAAIATRLEEHDRPDATQVVLPEAGHGVVAAIPYLPNELGPADLPESRKADALARTASWPKVLALLESLST
jgi:dienelactone hydrolase